MAATAPNVMSHEFDAVDARVRARPYYGYATTTLRACLLVYSQFFFMRRRVRAIGAELALRDIEADEAQP